VGRLLSIVMVIAAMFLGAGAANAAPATYEVSKQWTMSRSEDGVKIVPRMEDDTVEVNCKKGGTYVHHRTNDRELVDTLKPNTSNTGIWATPDFSVLKPGQTEVLKITVTCKKA
jgi:hypothetical protein